MEQMQRCVVWLALVGAACLLIGSLAPASWRPISLWATEPSSFGNIGAASDCAGELGDGKVDCYQGKLVPVDLYGEALCPDTTRFVHSVLAPLFSNGIAGLMHLRYFAYGKATETPAGLQCQHGHAECHVNRYINCAQRLHFRNESDWFNYVLCVQGKSATEIEKAASSVCAEQRGWDADELVNCAEGELGDRLEKLAGRASIAQKLTYLPTVHVNGMSIHFDLEHLGRYVCTAYTGRIRPAACFELARGSSGLGKPDAL